MRPDAWVPRCLATFLALVLVAASGCESPEPARAPGAHVATEREGGTRLSLTTARRSPVDAVATEGAEDASVRSAAPVVAAAGEQRLVLRDRELAGGPDEIEVAHGWSAPTPRTSRGRCWLRYGTLSANERTPGFAAFEARNPGWDAMNGIDPFTGLARAATLGTDVAQGGSTEPRELIRRARTLVRRNADLLGLRPSDAPNLIWEAHGSAPLYFVDAKLEPPAPPAKAPYPELEPAVALDVLFGLDGAFRWIQSTVSPGHSICTRPALSESQVRQLPGLVGLRLLAASMRGGPVDGGTVKLKDVTGVELGINVEENDRVREVRLVYRVTVAPDGGSRWIIVVDAMDGRVLRVRH
jgi:hypothetical protein